MPEHPPASSAHPPASSAPAGGQQQQQQQQQHPPAILKAAFPQARVKSIMRGEDVAAAPVVGHDAVFAATLATEMFLEYLVERSFANTRGEGRRVVGYRDIAKAVTDTMDLAFLEDVIPQTVPIKAALETREKLLKMQEAFAPTIAAAGAAAEAAAAAAASAAKQTEKLEGGTETTAGAAPPP
ncbi:hypothetical protein HDU87_006443 [Geranomyces variabilis]|uniref:Transcription factor CBF/NF-Y/archaeal histone domain-containing protein n=1 Tax=Geranomyces variabilis TaxID=109894 RepID=A0AAD5TFX1_9FUNG|nr:hypothetical protein HDU87_006443 [Geranomyces variabilis]